MYIMLSHEMMEISINQRKTVRCICCTKYMVLYITDSLLATGDRVGMPKSLKNQLSGALFANNF